jgi:predicted  nucleic acid-binding Zn-ribbon protein
LFMKPEESPIPESIDTDVWQEATPNPTDEQPENLSANTARETTVPNSAAENPIKDDPKTESVSQVLELQDNSASIQDVLYADALQRVRELKQEEANLKIEIAQLQATYKNLQTQINTTQTNLSNIVQDSLAQLEQRKQALQISVEQLERRQERIRNEMRTTFAGASQDLAIRVQGFKDYLAGSLQDLAAAAEQLQLVPTVREREKPAAREKEVVKSAESQLNIPQIAQQQFPETTKQIRRLIDQYRNQPDYYGPAWQLRRTFEPVHGERVSNWFFNMGGRGALRTMGSRLQNILVASAAISILHKLYGDRLRTLILANTPERLGEWRRGLQDCLGIGRPDFGPDRGVTLFEAPVALAQRADRLTKANQMPLIIIDDSEEQINLALLQFPLWLAFAPDPKTLRERDFEDDF